MSEIPKAGLDAACHHFDTGLETGRDRLEAALLAALPAIEQKIRQDLEAALLSEESCVAAYYAFEETKRTNMQKALEAAIRAALSTQTGEEGE